MLLYFSFCVVVVGNKRHSHALHFNWWNGNAIGSYAVYNLYIAMWFVSSYVMLYHCDAVKYTGYDNIYKVYHWNAFVNCVLL